MFSGIWRIVSPEEKTLELLESLGRCLQASGNARPVLPLLLPFASAFFPLPCWVGLQFNSERVRMWLPLTIGLNAN